MGGEDSSGKTLDNVFLFNLKNYSYHSLKHMKYARKNFAICSIGEKTLITGGWTGNNGKRVFLSQTEIYDILKENWASGPPLKKGRDGTRALLVGDVVLIIGGYDGELLSSIQQLNIRKLL